MPVYSGRVWDEEQDLAPQLSGGGCGLGSGTGSVRLRCKKSKKEVTDITVWNYYNGDQLESFNRLVSTFNETIGKAKGIRVSGSSQGTVYDLEANVMDAAEGKVGSAEMPTILPPTRIPLINWIRWAWWWT